MTLRLSVALCTFNGEKYLPEQLASISSQLRLPDELVVCDDASTDSTRSIIEDFVSSAPFPVRTHFNDRNRGTTRNFETAIALSSGDVIALCDQDDVWLPHKLVRLESEFLARPESGLVFSNAQIVDEQLQPTGLNLWEAVGFDAERQKLLTKRERSLEVLLPGWTVTGATMAFRSKYKPVALEIPDDLPIVHDGWIALVVAALSDVAMIKEPLIKYRQHTAQQIGAPKHRLAEQTPKSSAHVRDAFIRSNSYEALIDIACRLRERLETAAQIFETDQAIQQLDSRLAHMRSRANLPKSPIERVPVVLAELLSLRYSRFSNGIYSAVKDLLA
ncbi:MAG TPA: glycosyltransferase family 2 protein [Pyrinomonadaceae bacterium]|nr:glycosyltransferase family 2 protein [Pyrinomonadaceae bacterium]